MLAVIEGPDGSGKTTLIETLRRELGLYFWVMRPSRPPSELYEIMEVLTWVSRRPWVQAIVMDRHPGISEPIYGPLLRNVNLLEKMPPSLVLDDIDFIIYCRPPLDTILENVGRSRAVQMAGVVDHTPELVAAYDAKIADTVCLDVPVYVYDYTHMVLSDFFPLFHQATYGASNGINRLPG